MSDPIRSTRHPTDPPEDSRGWPRNPVDAFTCALAKAVARRLLAEGNSAETRTSRAEHEEEKPRR